MQVLVMDAASGTDFAVIRYWINFDGCNFGFAPFVIVPEPSPPINIEGIIRMHQLCPKEAAVVRNYFITDRERKERRKRGWKSYYFPPVVPPVRATLRRVRSNLGPKNIGCLNFKKYA